MSDYSLEQAKIDIASLQHKLGRLERNINPMVGKSIFHNNLQVNGDLAITTLSGAGFKDEDDMASDSATVAASQQSIKAYTDGKFTFLTSPLTSTSFDGDSFSTTAKTKIDLSAAFSAPAGIKAIDVTIKAKDSGSAGAVCLFALSPNDTAASYVLVCKPHDRANDTNEWSSDTVPCDASGDVYYQCIASGADTLDVTIEIWGYWT